MPKWWSEGIFSACVRAAENAFPNEVCGLFSAHQGEVRLHVLPSITSPNFVEAKPESVVALAYQLETEGRNVVATFHSHPQGQRNFSARDAMLRLWAHSHMLAVKTPDGWEMIYRECNEP